MRPNSMPQETQIPGCFLIRLMLVLWVALRINNHRLPNTFETLSILIPRQMPLILPAYLYQFKLTQSF